MVGTDTSSRPERAAVSQPPPQPSDWRVFYWASMTIGCSPPGSLWLLSSFHSLCIWTQRKADELRSSMSLQRLWKRKLYKYMYILTTQFQLNLYYTLASHTDQPRNRKISSSFIIYWHSAILVSLWYNIIYIIILFTTECLLLYFSF